MTLGRWHSTKSLTFGGDKGSIYYTCVVYLLNGIRRQIYLIEMILACLKINMKHPKKHHFWNMSTPTCDVTMYKIVVPCCMPRGHFSTMSPPLVGRNFSSVDILLTFILCKCYIMILLKNFSSVDILLTFTLCQCCIMILRNKLSGTGARSTKYFKISIQDCRNISNGN